MSSIVLYIHDPVDARRVEVDIVRALKLLKQAIKDSHLDNVVLLYRVASKKRNPKMYQRALVEWQELAKSLDCEVREAIPVFGTLDYNEKLNRKNYN